MENVSEPGLSEHATESDQEFHSFDKLTFKKPTGDPSFMLFAKAFVLENYLGILYDIFTLLVLKLYLTQLGDSEVYE